MPDNFSDSSDNDADVFLCRNLPTIIPNENTSLFPGKLKKKSFSKTKTFKCFHPEMANVNSPLFSPHLFFFLLLCSVAAIKLGRGLFFCFFGLDIKPTFTKS